jgi:hypothetical protein
MAGLVRAARRGKIAAVFAALALLATAVGLLRHTRAPSISLLRFGGEVGGERVAFFRFTNPSSKGYCYSGEGTNMIGIFLHIWTKTGQRVTRDPNYYWGTLAVSVAGDQQWRMAPCNGSFDFSVSLSTNLGGPVTVGMNLLPGPARDFDRRRQEIKNGPWLSDKRLRVWLRDHHWHRLADVFGNEFGEQFIWTKPFDIRTTNPAVLWLPRLKGGKKSPSRSLFRGRTPRRTRLGAIPCTPSSAPRARRKSGLRFTH